MEHVERLVDGVKALNRIVYDVNKTPPFDMIKVFPDESLTSPGKRQVVPGNRRFSMQDELHASATWLDLESCAIKP